MNRRNLKIAGLAIIAIVVLAAAVTAQSLLVNKPGGGPAFILRANELALVAKSSEVLDCSKPTAAGGKGVPAVKRVVNVGDPQLIQGEDGRRFTAAIWSPNGEAIVFVSPTDDIRPLGDVQTEDPLSDRPVAVSRNELWLFQPSSQAWSLITEDGSRPRFEGDGKKLFYLSGSQLITYDLSKRTSISSDISGTETPSGLLQTQVLSDGTLLVPSSTTSVVEHIGAKDGRETWKPLELTLADRLSIGPDDRSMAVVYGAASANSTSTTALVLFKGNGEALPLLRNCPYSAEELSWSQTGTEVAYPVLGNTSEVQLYSLQSEMRQTLFDLPAAERISGITFSPDGKYLAFSLSGAHSPTIWVVTSDGSSWQKIDTGLMPKWSPAGSALLYASPKGQSLNWHILDLKP